MIQGVSGVSKPFGKFCHCLFLIYQSEGQSLEEYMSSSAGTPQVCWQGSMQVGMWVVPNPWMPAVEHGMLHDFLGLKEKELVAGMSMWSNGGLEDDILIDRVLLRINDTIRVQDASDLLETNCWASNFRNISIEPWKPYCRGGVCHAAVWCRSVWSSKSIGPSWIGGQCWLCAAGGCAYPAGRIRSCALL